MTKRLCALGLVVLLVPLASARAADPDTLEAAVAQVKAVTDPDPAKQDRKRAEAALTIVQARVKVLNDVSGTFLQTIPIDVWNQAFGGSTILDRAKVMDEARKKGWDLARVAWIIQGGQCDEHASLMKHILNGAGVRNVTILRSNSPHAFPVVGLAAGADPDIPWTWGKDAFIADSWYGGIVAPTESWDQKIYFDSGKAFVAPGAAMSTREKLQKMAERGEAYIKEHCDVYEPLMVKYKQIPESVRAGLSFKPPLDACTVCEDLSGSWSGQLSVTDVSGTTSIEKGQKRNAQFVVAQSKDCSVTLKWGSNEIRGKAEKGKAELSEKVAGALSHASLSLESGALKVVIRQALGGSGSVTSDGTLKR